MQTERVTFLTSRDHKAALDAFAKQSGMSVGHLVREATTRFMAQPSDDREDEDEAALRLLAQELEQAAPRIQASLERIADKLQTLHSENDAFLRARGVRA